LNCSSRALEINPKYAQAHYYLSWIYYKKEDYKVRLRTWIRLEAGHCARPLFLEKLKPYREGKGARKKGSGVGAQEFGDKGSPQD